MPLCTRNWLVGSTRSSRFMAREAEVAVCLQGCADHQHCVTAIRVEGCVQIALPGFRGFPRKPLVDLEGEAPIASGFRRRSPPQNLPSVLASWARLVAIRASCWGSFGSGVDLPFGHQLLP